MSSTTNTPDSDKPPDSVPPSSIEPWRAITRICFRFVFVYEILYSFPFPATLIPATDRIFAWYDNLFAALTTWTAAHLLHVAKPVVFSPMESGDSLFGWTQNLVKIVVALLAAVVWAILDRKRSNYRTLQQWLWLYVRLVLGSAMIAYGALKIIKVQFPDMFLWRLLSPYGDSTPTGLLWSFMGYSRIYNVFTGTAEFVGGALLFFPRLATLGALISLGSMANVFMLNVGYDVNVKLYSLNLLMMSVYVLAPEYRRLLNVFVLNRAAPPISRSPLSQKKRLASAIVCAQLALLAFVSISELYKSHQRYWQSGDGAPQPSLYGVYDVEEFAVDGQARPALLTDANRWHRVTFERYRLMAVFPDDGPVQRYRTTIDSSKHTLQLAGIVPGDWTAEFTIEEPGPDLLRLNGEMDGKQLQVKLRKIEIKSFPLYANGFHWIR